MIEKRIGKRNPSMLESEERLILKPEVRIYAINSARRCCCQKERRRIGAVRKALSLPRKKEVAFTSFRTTWTI